MNKHTLTRAAIALIATAFGCDLAFAEDAGTAPVAGADAEPRIAARRVAPSPEPSARFAAPLPEPAAPAVPVDAHGFANLRILLTDAPIDDVDSVFVTFTEVQLESCPAPPPTDAAAIEEEEIIIILDEEDASEPEVEAAEADDASAAGCTWLSLVQEPVTLDLLTLQGGVTAELGRYALPPGDYPRLRLPLAGATVVVDGQEFALDLGADDPADAPVFVGTMLDADNETVLTLDFDAAQSMHPTAEGGWTMLPVIAVVSETANTSVG